MKKGKYIDDYIMEGDDVGALRYLAKEQYANGNIGGTRKRLIERVADKLERVQKKVFDYDECPSRMKKTSSGMFAFQHECAGRVIVTYEENENYKARCENCGVVFEVNCKSQDSAILKWNRHCLECKSLADVGYEKIEICGDCEHYNTWEGNCDKLNIIVDASDYCCSSYKEREDGI